jgi:hypothetical protein
MHEGGFFARSMKNYVGTCAEYAIVKATRWHQLKLVTSIKHVGITMLSATVVRVCLGYVGLYDGQRKNSLIGYQLESPGSNHCMRMMQLQRLHHMIITSLPLGIIVLKQYVLLVVW